jgi:hypothetical protein
MQVYCISGCLPVFWIWIGFNADPVQALCLNADPYPYPDPGSQINADPGQTWLS